MASPQKRPILLNGARAFGALAHDVVMAALALLLSIYLRYGDTMVAIPSGLLAGYVGGFAAIAAAVFLGTGLYRGIWRYASLPDVMALLRATTLTIFIAALVFFFVTRLELMPRSTFVICWFVMLALLGGPRFAYRAIKDHGLSNILSRRDGSAVPVLLIGVNDSTHAFIREMARERTAPYEVVGLVAVTSRRVGRDVAGVPVLGTLAELPQVIERLDRRGQRPRRLIIASDGVDGAAVRQLLDTADRLAIPLARLPRLTDFRDAPKDGAARIEPVAIEDLLGRPQAVLDRKSMRRLVEGRRVLVTGAGGTIGAELVRQVAALGPGRLTLFDSSEYQLYSIDREILEAHPDLPREAVIGDVRDARRVDEAIAAARPELVFHAAALKHVPIVEAHPIEGVLTNTVGTRNVAESCRAHGVGAMVLISTDKAVNPGNVMGATKRVAEMICQALDLAEASRAGGTHYVTVRFGNVLGSTGSVVPLFQHQLARGGPLTVTDREITRFFMTVREAVELVLQAAALAQEEAARGRIFVLDMGEPVRIVDLARQMIRLAGLKPEQDVRIEFIGLRPGEKLHEELFYADEALAPTRIPSIRLASPRSLDAAALAPLLNMLAEAARERRSERALEVLARLVPEFRARSSSSLPPSPPSPSRGEEAVLAAAAEFSPSPLEGEDGEGGRLPRAL
ncbi:MAG TPA: nucleoside-diphosphate sugar epimerase/dehydratase [Stellaceae bacterium]|nr:nucleoside-diphosphate sugar epimerase/dehydratase [Stellaceae bacterium]